MSYDEIEHDVKLLKRLIAERRENLKVKVTARVDKFNGNNLFSLLKRKNDDTIKNVQLTFELALSSKNNDFQQAGRLGVLVHDLTAGNRKPDLSNINQINYDLKKMRDKPQIEKVDNTIFSFFQKFFLKMICFPIC